MDAHEIYRKAVETYGVEAQTKMAIEEMAELTNALMKYARGRVTIADIVEEVADVYVMMQQLAIIYGPKTVQLLIDYKTQRLAKRLNKEE